MSLNLNNINSLWASMLVEELTRHRITYFCVSPGSRSTPLTVAAAENDLAETVVHFDERGAAYHAVGYARGCGKPAVLICTSGTAVANYYPAVIEAYMSGLPLIVLSADRPPELHGTGANQTIFQSGIFGRYAKWHCDLPCPDRSVESPMVLKTLDEAVANAIAPPAGPVHINCMFREPLAPVDEGENFEQYLALLASWMKTGETYGSVGSQPSEAAEEDVEHAVAVVNGTKHGLLIAGRLRNEVQRQAVRQLAEKLNWPLLPDVTSGLRLGRSELASVPFYDQLLLSQRFRNEHSPDTIIHIGGAVVSKRLLEFIEAAKPNAYLVIHDGPVRYDPVHRVTRQIVCEAGVLCSELAQKVHRRDPDEWLTEFQSASDAVRFSIGECTNEEPSLSEPKLARRLSETIPDATGLFLASSLPIREVDMFSLDGGAGVTVGANRGASGIDGTIASAAGFAVGLKLPVTLLVGDLAFLHDMNSLALLKNTPVPVIIVLVNNNGGNIFSMLPIAEFGQLFEKFFITPHNLTFEKAAELFSLPYAQVASADDFGREYLAAMATGSSALIEVIIDRQQTIRAHRDIADSIRRKLGK